MMATRDAMRKALPAEYRINQPLTHGENEWLDNLYRGPADRTPQDHVLLPKLTDDEKEWFSRCSQWGMPPSVKRLMDPFAKDMPAPVPADLLAKDMPALVPVDPLDEDMPALEEEEEEEAVPKVPLPTRDTAVRTLQDSVPGFGFASRGHAPLIRAYDETDFEHLE
jgi:hypothetical protein